MEIIKNEDSENLIPIIHFDNCLLDGKTREEISKLYTKDSVRLGKKSCYYLEKFEHHLKIKFNLTLRQYCKQFINEDWPICPICGKEVGFKIDGKGLNLYKYATTVTKEHSEKFRISCERISKERMGDGNPMYGKKPWNKGLDLDNPIIRRIAESRRGVPLSEDHKRKLSEARERHPLKARHTTKHSPENIEKFKIINAKKWADGVFNKKTSIEVKMENFLNSLKLKSKFVFQYQVVYFTLDFSFPDAKVGIECDGDYYHVNPVFYPDGPKTEMQRRNFGRDKVKNEFLEKKGWTILRFWECEINSDVFKEKLICKLKELNLLEE